ncbi:xanthine dehydrogenase family protein subunit M [Paenibacillus sp. XY044]|uniref:FAD binding domain-containing protein n=1 Tax=Paenibacillus sp. XY044 TaxID=2026089 RepID=UPI000B98E8B1|nr:FAD binding domain-containing protein [Paenibacillus sp. XY044]OZB91198.1 xanthine dehydrogenase [Paenibacillus sp. XY044]
MIPFDFEYYRPSSVKEAVDAFQALQTQGKHPMYWSGGTEIITMARLNRVRPGAVVDLKAIPECNVMEFRGNDLIIGGCVTLSAVTGANLFPLLGRAAQGVADQTSRNKITLGGNLCGRIRYREAVLPLLVADSRLVIAGKGGIREAAIHEVFHGQIRLEPGEFLLQTVTDREFVSLPSVHVKKRQIGHVGYPLVTLVALKKGSRIHAAFSGICGFPFRSAAIEQVLNTPGLSAEERARQVAGHLPAPPLTNTEGKADYRLFLFEQTVKDAVNALEGR